MLNAPNTPTNQPTSPTAMAVADANQAPGSWRTRVGDWLIATGERISREPGTLWPPLAARPGVCDKSASAQPPEAS